MFLSKIIKTDLCPGVEYARGGEGCHHSAQISKHSQLTQKLFFPGKNPFVPIHLTSVGGQGEPRPDPALSWDKSPVLALSSTITDMVLTASSVMLTDSHKNGTVILAITF